MANQYRSVLASSGPAPTGGDALPAEVLSGKTFTNDNGAQTGTMTNNGAVTQTLAAGASYTIPEGYHNGSGTVTANGISLISATHEEIGRPGTITYSVSEGNMIAVYIVTRGNYTFTLSGGTIESGSLTLNNHECYAVIKATSSTVTIQRSTYDETNLANAYSFIFG